MLYKTRLWFELLYDLMLGLVIVIVLTLKMNSIYIPFGTVYYNMAIISKFICNIICVFEFIVHAIVMIDRIQVTKRLYYGEI